MADLPPSGTYLVKKVDGNDNWQEEIFDSDDISELGGALLSQVVTITGNQTISGEKTFADAATFQSDVTLAADPDQPLEAATKQYVDSEILAASGSISDGITLTAEWQYDDSTSDSDPGSGNFRLNSTSPQSSATFAYIADETENSVDASLILSTVVSGDLLYIQQKGDSSRALLFEASGPSVDASGYWRIPLQSGEGTGTAVEDGEECVFILQRTGIRGPTVHSQLSGLSADDHTQYSLVDGTRAFTGTVGGIDPVSSTDLSTKNYVDSEISTTSGDLSQEIDDDIDAALTNVVQVLFTTGTDLNVTQTELPIASTEENPGSNYTVNANNVTCISSGLYEVTYNVEGERGSGGVQRKNIRATLVVDGTPETQSITSAYIRDATNNHVSVGTTRLVRFATASGTLGIRTEEQGTGGATSFTLDSGHLLIKRLGD